jgi:hypothetical protein
VSTACRDEQSDLSLRQQSYAFWRVLLLSLLAFASLAQWLPADPRPASYRVTVRQVWPQTWSFYTDVAGGSQVSAYRWPAAGGGSPEPLAVRQGGRASIGGLRRTTHAQLAELARVAAGVPADRWRSCPGGQLVACLPTGPEPAVELVNAAPWPTICGSVLLAVELRAAGRTTDVVRIERRALVDLTCSRP